MSYTIITSDNGVGTTGASMAGRTLNNADGGSASNTWTIGGGTFTINTNRMNGSGVGSDNTVYVASTPSVGNCFVEATVAGTSLSIDCGLQIHRTGSGLFGDGYLFYCQTKQLFKSTAPATLALVATGTATWTTGDVLGVEWVGGLINTYHNGTIDISAYSDGTPGVRITGMPGLHGGGTGGGAWTDFKFKTPSLPIAFRKSLSSLGTRAGARQAS